MITFKSWEFQTTSQASEHYAKLLERQQKVKSSGILSLYLSSSTNDTNDCRLVISICANRDGRRLVKKIKPVGGEVVQLDDELMHALLKRHVDVVEQHEPGAHIRIKGPHHVKVAGLADAA